MTTYLTLCLSRNSIKLESGITTSFFGRVSSAMRNEIMPPITIINPRLRTIGRKRCGKLRAQASYRL